MAWELHLAACQSLKDKRHVLKSLKDRLHNRFNVSAAETAHHDLWQRAELTVCVVSTDRGHAERVLREADRLVEAADGARDRKSTRLNSSHSQISYAVFCLKKKKKKKTRENRYQTSG